MLTSTNARVLQLIDLATLKAHAVDGPTWSKEKCDVFSFAIFKMRARMAIRQAVVHSSNARKVRWKLDGALYGRLREVPFICTVEFVGLTKGELRTTD